MNEGQEKQNLIDTTDCLEAIGVFKGWKNFLFIILILCLLTLQLCFWLINADVVKAAGESEVSAAKESAVVEEKVASAIPEVQAEIEEAATQVVAEPNQPIEKAESKKKLFPIPFNVQVKHLVSLIQFVNFVIILIAVLYCLTMLFSLKVSLLGRLGGINHISRAFFLSLFFVVFLLPWQIMFSGIVEGAIYTPRELLDSFASAKTGVIFEIVFYYLRYTGFWLLEVLLVLFAQMRSVRWARATLKRLEVV